jgi:hypothetical protein
MKLSGGDPAGLWADQTSPKAQEKPGSKTQAHSQATAEFVGGRGQGDARCQRQPVKGYYLWPVWAAQRHQRSDSAIEGWQQDKYFPFGEAQRDSARPTDQLGSACSQRLAVELCVPMGVVVVAGFVELDQSSWPLARALSGYGFRSG